MVKISKKQKEISKQSLLQAAIELFEKEGFKQTSMREIARKAKLSDATIYHYFSSKEKIIYGYFESKISDAIVNIRNNPEFKKYSLQEQLHEFFEILFESFSKNKIFVKMASEFITNSSFDYIDNMRPSKNLLVKEIENIIKNAVIAKKIPDQSHTQIIIQLFWDYYCILLVYWLKDDSLNHQNTTLVLDRSLAIIISLFKGNIINKIMDLGLFFVKNHILSKIDTLVFDKNNLDKII